MVLFIEFSWLERYFEGSIEESVDSVGFVSFKWLKESTWLLVV